MAIQLHDLGRKIFFDRYALKDTSRKNIKAGDIVIAIIDEFKGQREIGIVSKINGAEITVDLENGDQITRHISQIDVPLEKSPEEMFTRVAAAMASVEKTPQKQTEWTNNFDWLMQDFRFLPGGRVLAMAGTGQNLTAFNCYVIAIKEDSRAGIMDALSEMTELMSRGGGVGLNFSMLRPKNNYVKGVNGRSSGAVSWASLFSYTTGLIEQGGCFAGDTRIATDKGLIQISELVQRIENGEAFMAQTHKGLRSITDTFRNGVKKTYTLKTKRGFSVTLTDNHPVGILQDGEVRTMMVKYLQPNDNILLLLDSGTSEANYARLKSYENNFANARKINTPTELNEELAYILGYSYADGYVYDPTQNTNGKRISFACADSYPTIKTRLIKYIKNQFGYDAIIHKGDGAYENISIYSNHVIEWLKLNGICKQKAEFVRVPEAIFQSPSSVMLSFIAGYFDADGCHKIRKTGTSRSSFQIDSISLGMINDLKKILAYHGILSDFSEANRDKQGWSTIYRLSITGNTWKNRFYELIPSEKTIGYIQGKRDMYTVYPSGIIDSYGIKPKHTKHIYDGKSKNLSIGQLTSIKSRLLDYGEQAIADRINELQKTVVDKIISIEEYQEIETFDITVEDAHMISSNVIYTSNSRRGAMMAILNDWHPDILSFISAKKQAGYMTNCNISVGASDAFMSAVKNNEQWSLRFPDTSYEKYGEEWDGDLELWESKGYPVIVHRTLPAREIWDAIIESAWRSAEPGLWFRDRANKMNNSWYFDKLISTNPCGEIGLGAYGVCNLGSLNLSKFYNGNGGFNEEELRKAVGYAVRFLDNVIDYTPYHLEETRIKQMNERRVGLGVLGFAELLIKCGIRYGSDEAVLFSERLFGIISEEAYLTSVNIAVEKGSFKKFDSNLFIQSGFVKTMPEHVIDKISQNGIRNVALLMSAPTGTIGTMSNTSTGIEPFFSWKFYRKSRLGLSEENVPLVQEWLDANPDKTIADLPDYFVTAMDLSPEEHAKMQGVVQRYIDQSISKTVNAPNEYTIEQVSNLYQYMYDLGCKGGTIYRDGSRDEQVLMKTDDNRVKEIKEEQTAAIKNINTSSVAVSASASNEAEVKLAPYKIADRSEVLDGKTVRVETAFGYAYITINTDPDGYPFEIFVSAPGKAGSDLQADAEGLGRLVSLTLRSVPQHQRLDALREIASQLKDISGSSIKGFGNRRIASLPDAVAYAIIENYLNVPAETSSSKVNVSVNPVSVTVRAASVNDYPSSDSVVAGSSKLSAGAAKYKIMSNGNGNGNGNHANAESMQAVLAPAKQKIRIKGATLCPSCKNHSLILTDGCKKCNVCDYSAC